MGSSRGGRCIWLDRREVISRGKNERERERVFWMTRIAEERDSGCGGGAMRSMVPDIS